MSVSLGNTHDVWRDLMEGSSDAVIVANQLKEVWVVTFKLGERGLQIWCQLGMCLLGGIRLSLRRSLINP
jgi:hypothetical protein